MENLQNEYLFPEVSSFWYLDYELWPSYHFISCSLSQTNCLDWCSINPNCFKISCFGMGIYSILMSRIKPYSTWLELGTLVTWDNKIIFWLCDITSWVLIFLHTLWPLIQIFMREFVHTQKYPHARLIRLGVGNTTEPIPDIITSSMAEVILWISDCCT